MRFFIFLILPFYCFSQTVHMKNEHIHYKGKVEVPVHSEDQIYRSVQKALLSTVKAYKELTPDEDSGKAIKVRGEIKLHSSLDLRQTIFYSIQVTAKKNSYHYVIDSVYLEDKRRSGDSTVLSSKEIWKEMGNTGKVAIATEKLLDDIDMNFEKLLAVLQKKVLASASITNDK